MFRLIQRVLKAFRDRRVIFIVITSISTQLIRSGMFASSLWLAKRAYASKSLMVEIYRCQSVASWTKEHGRVRLIYPKRPLVLLPARRVGYEKQYKNIHSHTHNFTLPPVSINVLVQVDVIGGSEMVFTHEGAVLYDELALGDASRYGVKAPEILPHGYFLPYLPAATDKFVQCIFQRNSSAIEISCAISLLKDHSHNYYHWLLECLPRAIIALNQKDLDSHPFLIDEGLPPQSVESLKLLAPTRKYIEIPLGVRVYVKELIFPSIFSPTHDYYGKTARAEDFLIAPEAVKLLREAFLPFALQDNMELNQPYIYISRSGGSHRLITNEAEVIDVVKKLGFTIVYPGKLSFTEQITLFSNAKVIIGPTGAGMANIIFAKADCKIAVLAAATKNANYYLFAQLAQYLGQLITYVAGKPSQPYEIHSNYNIDVSLLRNLITEYLATIDAVNIVDNLQRKN
jgi:hypothetical protein